MRRLSLFLLAIGGSGCLSMNTFETARTLPRGEMSHTIAITSYVPTEGTVAPVPMPKYAFHLGVTDSVEVGIHAGAPGQIRILTKYNPIRTKYFDLAISPGTWFAFVPHSVERENNVALLGADIPIMMNLNLGKTVSVIPWGGPGYVFSPAGGQGSPIVRTGMGIQFRVGDSVSLHPEFSTMIDPIRGEAIDYAFGMGVTLGARPAFM